MGQVFLDTRSLYPQRELVFVWDKETKSERFASKDGYWFDAHDTDGALRYFAGDYDDWPEVRFKCQDGLFEFDDKMATFLKGRKTRFLEVVGAPVSVDFTPIPVHLAYVMILHHGVINNCAMPFHAFPGTYCTGYATSHGHARIYFRVTDSGTIELDRDAGQFADVLDEAGTIRVNGVEVKIVSKLDSDVVLLATTLLPGETLTARLLPGGCHHVARKGAAPQEPKLRFYLDSNGELHVDPSCPECADVDDTFPKHPTLIVKAIPSGPWPPTTPCKFGET